MRGVLIKVTVSLGRVVRACDQPTPVHRRPKQENHDVEASMGCMRRPVSTMRKASLFVPTLNIQVPIVFILKLEAMTLGLDLLIRDPGVRLFSKA